MKGVYVLQYVRRFCADAIQKLSPSSEGDNLTVFQPSEQGRPRGAQLLRFSVVRRRCRIALLKCSG
jgi:hypothetical protein